jgi:hypothetical protein
MAGRDEADIDLLLNQLTAARDGVDQTIRFEGLPYLILEA